MPENTEPHEDEDAEPRGEDPHRQWSLSRLGRRRALVIVGSSIGVIATVLGVANDGIGVADRLGLTAQQSDSSASVPATPTASSTPTPAAPLRPGYWPTRSGYSAAEGANEPTLDSTIDDASYGDQRNFLQVRVKPDDPEDQSGWGYSIDAEPDDEIQVAAFVANSASPDLGQTGAVRGLTARLQTVVDGQTSQVGITLAAHNADDVWAAAVVRLGSPATLTFEDDSAEFLSGGGRFGLSDDLGDGNEIALGATGLDGTLPVRDLGSDSDPGSGWVTFTMWAVAP